VQLLNVKLIALSAPPMRRSLLSQAASTIQLLTFAHHSTSSAISHLPLALSLFTISLELEQNAATKYELEVCFEVAANFILVVLDAADRDNAQRIIALCEDHFAQFLQILIFYGKNYFWQNTRLISTMLRAYVLILAKYPERRLTDEENITDKMTEYLPNLIGFLISSFEELLLKNPTGQIDELRGLVGSALQATLGVSTHAIEEANQNGIGERLVDELARVQIKIALNKPKVILTVVLPKISIFFKIAIYFGQNFDFVANFLIFG